MMLSSTTPILRLLLLVSKCHQRTFFTFPEFNPLSISQLKKYHEQRVLPYSAKELYAVVADVASYPKFVPFCRASRIDASALGRAMQGKTMVDAELTIGFMNFTESYVSTVTCVPYKSVQAVASSSTPMFKSLCTVWNFQSATSLPRLGNSEALEDPPGHTLVSYDLSYEFANPLHGATSAAFFGQVAGLMIQAFEDRCSSIYGRRTMKAQKLFKPS